LSNSYRRGDPREFEIASDRQKAIKERSESPGPWPV
jgi:hypothetical protein